MNKLLVILSIGVFMFAVYMKRKADENKQKYLRCRQKLLSLQAQESLNVHVDNVRVHQAHVHHDETNEKSNETLISQLPSEKPQLISLATTALSPLLAFIGPNLLKKKNNFLNEMETSDFSLAQQLLELDEEEPRIIELTDDDTTIELIEDAVKPFEKLLIESKKNEKELDMLNDYAASIPSKDPSIADSSKDQSIADSSKDPSIADSSKDQSIADFLIVPQSPVFYYKTRVVESKDDEPSPIVKTTPMFIETEPTIAEPTIIETEMQCDNGVCTIKPKKRGRKPKNIENK